MFLIPLLWETQNKEAAHAKWTLVRKHFKQLYAVVIFGFIGILPQLLYWKFATGSFVYDVGSKWDFLTPHLQVLFGWEKGWFIYTPVALFFVLGLFFVRDFAFRKSVLWFCLLNIYVIISWHDWRYGGSYSCRALVQSYPVFALPLAAFIGKVERTKWSVPFLLIGAYLIGVNIFQLVQCNHGIIHHADMNRKYYASIYLNPTPTPFDYSLLDTDQSLKSEEGFSERTIYLLDTNTVLHLGIDSVQQLCSFDYSLSAKGAQENWLKVEASALSMTNDPILYLMLSIESMDTVIAREIRSFKPTKDKKQRGFGFYVRMPEIFDNGRLDISFRSNSSFDGALKDLKITALTK
jgi:ribosomal protein L34